MKNTYLNLTEEEEELMIQNEFRALLDDYANTAHVQKVEIITRAFEFAHKAHKGTKRCSGEPYIMHPLAVARIVVKEMGLGSTSICSALLHDVVEDTDYTCEDIAREFNPKIASIVEGLTKISGGIFGERASEQAENFRKLILTIPEDVRVILIKMADRLHNMRTLGSMPPAKQLKIAGETQYIYAPLAQRLGFFLIKTELEDLSFKYEQPKLYQTIKDDIDRVTPNIEKDYEEFIKPITEVLNGYGYKYTITNRIKTPYSVFKKMQKKNIPFDEVYDILAVRIILKPKPGENEKANCWVTYSVITSIYKAHPDRTRDFLNAPKTNGYEALHVTVMAQNGKWIEVQIRSERMNDIAEKGLAAHWKYKTGEEGSDLDNWFRSVKEMLDNTDYSNAIEIMDTFKLNLYSNEIFVFTPKGEIIKMPAKSTALDFAFQLHTELGERCIGAKVDHKLVPISYVLQSGNQVEILTSKSQKPKQEWIEIVTTAKAKGHLRYLFKKEFKSDYQKGQKMVEEELAQLNLPFNSDNLQKILEYYNINSTNQLFYDISRGKIPLSSGIRTIFKNTSGSKLVNIWKLTFGNTSKKKDDAKNTPKKDTIHLTASDAGTAYKLADCCQPIPGDSVLGFLADDGTVIVHKINCDIAVKLQSSFGNRIVSADWATQQVLSFLASIEISGIDKMGVLREIVKVITDDYSINIKNMNIQTKDGIFKGTFSVYVHNTEDLNNLCLNLLKIKSVKSVKRID
ncbi:MAG: bifunctional (p)ppGpp synthetase/guanosine-3',5'-bis(diphosphate) 3'-pyrophosphohydrolase [Paludibacteraceae bacterium]|jgi:GTP pyrophosphokinase|nr:bifunctional (p)ppGpp synthetase/guanosine-3',5'-bis(diphosphate) 3'-pyrophosphohydrolase [Paludibacteraceae bacterium]MDI9536706.1 RelA/SpoT family protein [Bacteroidota bacterium]OQC33629.1 MAG: GTP pyrophosphokinase [Bacteroidetes bacterium ADurb.Bin057]HHT61018.1 bifunctional (p)ppGpp synthetase/guanosine-3',5'-bis(diphosphate) 3'-pyrophosphohydrolase [Bacteroidales bacterium]MBP9038968.1 bifunctional (p)ppGpp synthetase/guanosine-3',5'-bis(diphosphate) 3'-pyrophosphohydrolase [Paludibac